MNKEDFSSRKCALGRFNNQDESAIDPAQLSHIADFRAKATNNI